MANSPKFRISTRFLQMKTFCLPHKIFLLHHDPPETLSFFLHSNSMQSEFVSTKSHFKHPHNRNLNSVKRFYYHNLWRKLESTYFYIARSLCTLTKLLRLSVGFGTPSVDNTSTSSILTVHMMIPNKWHQNAMI